jgi:hypothetical protein
MPATKQYFTPLDKHYLPSAYRHVRSFTTSRRRRRAAVTLRD